MLYGKYMFQCRFETEAILPPYKGSTLRGVFGRALRQVVCALKRQECPDCLLKTNCIYPLVFEPHLAVEIQDGKHENSPPHPYAIQPPQDTKSNYLPNDPFEFELLLFGPINKQLPYFIYAIDKMGKIGIGKMINGQRGKYHLEMVKLDGKVIFKGSDQKLIDVSPRTDFILDPADTQPAGKQTIKIRLKTPLRTKHQNSLSPELPFHVLVRAMLRRASSLFESYGNGEPSLDYKGLVQRAQDVQILDQSLEWIDWKRYSHRQDQAMMMGGLKGSITYQGDISEFIPLIEFCVLVHLGKQTTFGLGRIAIEDLK